MGNICGKGSKDSDPFSQPGRTLGSAPPPPSTNARSSIPPNIRSQGRTLGGPLGGDTEDARRAAAQAAEGITGLLKSMLIDAMQERALKSRQPKGKLGSQLAKERQQTRTDTLGQASREERRARDADTSAEARNWN
ncbi:MAG: hypothetical protein M1830_005668 [Pleopsidium flavum]|nr:MAG: hypothetical protein M1830_005668 [Pleopsidium flavum]